MKEWNICEVEEIMNKKYALLKSEIFLKGKSELVISISGQSLYYITHIPLADLNSMTSLDCVYYLIDKYVRLKGAYYD